MAAGSAIATANAGVSAASQSAAASVAYVQSAATASVAQYQSATSSYQRQPLQPVPQTELSIVSLDNLECILQALWGTTSGSTSQMVQLTATTDLEDFGQASNLFKLPGRTLHNIYRVQNVTLFVQYMTEKRKMDQMYATQADFSVSKELFLYHGTNRMNVENINANGFDRSYSGTNGTVYGKGAYFARDLSYSANDKFSPVDATSGHKFVYAARVLVGRFCQGTPNMQYLPNQESGISFDSAVDNVAYPNVFVIFRDIRAYPSYLFEFSWLSHVEIPLYQIFLITSNLQ